MKPGDLVKLRNELMPLWCELWNIPSLHIEHEPRITGEIIIGELCLVLEAVEKFHGRKWLRIISPRSGATGWVEEDLMDVVEVLQ